MDATLTLKKTVVLTPVSLKRRLRNAVLCQIGLTVWLVLINACLPAQRQHDEWLIRFMYLASFGIMSYVLITRIYEMRTIIKTPLADLLLESVKPNGRAFIRLWIAQIYENEFDTIRATLPRNLEKKTRITFAIMRAQHMDYWELHKLAFDPEADIMWAYALLTRHNDPAFTLQLGDLVQLVERGVIVDDKLRSLLKRQFDRHGLRTHFQCYAKAYNYPVFTDLFLERLEEMVRNKCYDASYHGPKDPIWYIDEIPYHRPEFAKAAVQVALRLRKDGLVPPFSSERLEKFLIIMGIDTTKS